MNETCGTCDNWKHEEDQGDFGYCEKILDDVVDIYQVLNIDPEDKERFCTKRSFGCIHWISSGR